MKRQNKGKTLVLTGGSSGIGLKTAKLFADTGYTVYELSRSGSSKNNIIHIYTDVSDEESVNSAFYKIKNQVDGIDLLICNAGSGISGAVEFTEYAEAKKQFDVNFFGTTEVICKALPLLRNNRGRIICVGSVAGVISIPFQAYYSASKAALGSFCEALRNEVAHFGIDVTCLTPGDVKTGFTGSRLKQHDGEELYEGRINRSVTLMEKDEQAGMEPSLVAKRLFKIASYRTVRPYYTVGSGYKLLVMLAKLLPKRLVRYIVGLIYAK